MNSRDKAGIAILVGLMLLLCSVLAWTFSTPSTSARKFSESPIVKQRMININKGN